MKFESLLLVPDKARDQEKIRELEQENARMRKFESKNKDLKRENKDFKREIKDLKRERTRILREKSRILRVRTRILREGTRGWQKRYASWKAPLMSRPWGRDPIRNQKPNLFRSTLTKMCFKISKFYVIVPKI